MQSKAEQRAKTAESQLEGSRQVAEAAKRHADKWKSEAEAARKQPIVAVVDEDELTAGQQKRLGVLQMPGMPNWPRTTPA